MALVSYRTTTPKGDGLPPDGGWPGSLWSTALAALGHPVGCASIVLLLLNDHFLKREYASAITGKLSDFAGVFFFPFLLAAVLGLAAKATLWRRPAAPTGRRRAKVAVIACFVLTALCFAAVKVLPIANQAAVVALETLLGLPVRIVRDPTDLLALASLWPAWKLWVAVGRQRPRRVASRSLLALGLASLASLATTCPPLDSVSLLVPFEDGVYALATSWHRISDVFRSSDGVSWDSVLMEAVPAEVLEKAATPVALPKVACVPRLEGTCYRVSGEEQVETSADGGATWQTAWEAPTTRRPYMQRVASRPICGKTLDFRANDVLVVGGGSDHIVVVALGNEGILRGPAWSRIGVGTASATPDRGTLSQVLFPMIILGETLVAVLASATGLWLLSEVSWRIHRLPGVRRSRAPWVVAAAAVLVLVFLLLPLFLGSFIILALVPFALAAALAAYLWSGWGQAIASAADAAKARRALGVSLLGGLLIGLGVWSPFALWVLGAIPGYPAAVALALAVGGAILVVLWRKLRRLSATSEVQRI